MRFRHLQESSLDKKVTDTAKTDEKTVAKAQLLHSKEWKEHVAEHHGAGDEAQLIAVDTEEDNDSELLKKTEEKKEPKEEQPAQQHTLNHEQDGGASKGAYLGKSNVSSRSGPGSYFGADTARGKAMISGQCSCGMEVSTGWQSEQTPGQPTGTAAALQAAYNKGDTTADKREDTPLYSTGMASPNAPGQERPLYNSSQPTGSTSGFGDQKRRRTSSL